MDAAVHRKCILFNAARLFIQYGYRDVSLEDIAFDTGLDREAILELYPSKNLIYEEIMDAMASGESSGPLPN